MALVKEKKESKEATGLKLEVMIVSSDSSNKELDKLIKNKVEDWRKVNEVEIVDYKISIDFDHNGLGSALISIIYK